MTVSDTAVESQAKNYKHSVRVRYVDCDMQGVVYNSHYLTFVDDGFDCWVRQLGATFEEDYGWEVMLKKAERAGAFRPAPGHRYGSFPLGQYQLRHSLRGYRRSPPDLRRDHYLCDRRPRAVSTNTGSRSAARAHRLSTQ